MDSISLPVSKCGDRPSVSPPPGRVSPGVQRSINLSVSHGTMLAHDMLSKLHKVSYSSPPPIACSPENNVCKLIDYRSAKVAAFVVEGRELICLPQAFELFLKHLVGGLHTVYTKLKRLDIIPVVCNVEQVRILRGLGAIQPGVNRCKLISCKEFDILYDDCTNSSARPGRPPKRSPSLHASPETIEKLKKSRLDGTEYYTHRMFADGKSMLNGFPPHPYALGPLPFLHINHPLFTAPPMMASQLPLGPDSFMTKDIPHHIESTERATEGKEEVRHVGSSAAYLYNDNKRTQPEHDSTNVPLNLHINGHEPDSSGNTSPGIKSDNNEDDDEFDDDISDDGKSEDDSHEGVTSFIDNNVSDERVSQQEGSTANPQNGTNVRGFSSIETLLLNIQGLLKVAAENARHQERQFTFEKAELKMEIYKEKKAREDVQKHLTREQKEITILQRRLKKERRARKRLEGQIGCLDRLHNLPIEHTHTVATHLLKNNKCITDTEAIEEDTAPSNNLSDTERSRSSSNFPSIPQQ